LPAGEIEPRRIVMRQLDGFELRLGDLRQRGKGPRMAPLAVSEEKVTRR